MDEQISARQSKFYLRYCATESAVCHAISKLRYLYSMTLYSQSSFLLCIISHVSYFVMLYTLTIYIYS